MKRIQRTNQKLNAMHGGTAFSLLIILYILLSTILSALVNILNVSKPFDGTILSLSSPIAILIVLLAFRKRNGVTAKDLNAKPFSVWFVLFAVILAVGILFAFGTVNELIAKLIYSLGGKVSSSLVPVGAWWIYLTSTLVFCVLPAIAEELFFRGLLLESVKNTNKVVAIISVSLLFSIYHGNATQLAYQFIYGVILCLITLGAKSVVPAIITHFLNNFTVLNFMQFKVSINLYAWWIILIGVVLTVSVLYFIVKNISFKEKGKEKLKDFYLYSLFGLLICVALIITGVAL